MPQIVSHHANVAGPGSSVGRDAIALESCLARGWAVAITIRAGGDGTFSASLGDQASLHRESAFDEMCAVLRCYPQATAALYADVPGREGALLQYLRTHEVLSQVCLLGLDPPHATPGTAARLYGELAPSVRIAAHVSDRMPVELALEIEAASVVWLDEVNRQWATARDIARLKNQGRTVYAQSPDLHGVPFDAARRRWEDFIRWGVDGICTDYPGALANLIQRSAVGIARAS